jgi:hypothetical protein
MYPAINVAYDSIFVTLLMYPVSFYIYPMTLSKYSVNYFYVSYELFDVFYDLIDVSCYAADAEEVVAGGAPVVQPPGPQVPLEEKVYRNKKTKLKATLHIEGNYAKSAQMHSSTAKSIK